MNKEKRLLLGVSILSIGIFWGSYTIGRWQTGKTEPLNGGWTHESTSDQNGGRTNAKAKRHFRKTRKIPEALKTDFPLYDLMFTVAGEDVIETEADRQYPRREWLRMLMSKGIPIETFSYYSGWLSSRWGLVYAKADPEELASLKRTCNLPPDAS